MSKSPSLARRIGLLAAGAVAAGAAIANGNVFRDAINTADGYPTWDADMINIEKVTQTGRGVYVAVLDTGLAPNWADYFPTARIATHLGKGFKQPVSFRGTNDPCALGAEVGTLHETSFIGSVGSEHGTHVTSTIVGFGYRSNSDAAAGFSLPPIQVRGIAPDVTIIPVKVLADYQIPALPNCDDPEPPPSGTAVFGTSAMIAAGIDYVTDLAIAGYRPMVINMSLGGPELEPVEKAAVDRAIRHGVIVVAAAGNEGDLGMSYPGAYAPVISAGAAGWTKQWRRPDTLQPSYRMWWLQDGGDFTPPLLSNTGEIAEPTPANEVFVANFSSRDLGRDQELDVLAPGVHVRGPFAGFPGYTHLPWWSQGIADLVSRANPGNFFYVSGTSMAAPHVAAAAALLLEKDPSLTQAQIETLLKSTTLPIGRGTAQIAFPTGIETQTWGSNATGTGLIQVDAAIAAMSAQKSRR